MRARKQLLIVGAGIFGITAAIEIQRRGWSVTLIDPGPVPHPLAASTDISKVIRMEYGADEQYMEMMESALAGWRLWNHRWPEPLFHETGVAMLTRTPMRPDGFEYESWQLLQKRLHEPERLNPSIIQSRFPAWKANSYADGYYHAKGGYAESGRVVSALLNEAEREGVILLNDSKMTSLQIQDGICQGVIINGNQHLNTTHTLIAAGAWTPYLLPELHPFMHATGHPIFHLTATASTAEPFSPPNFPVFTADIANSGWYGFPMHPRENVIKIANHGRGIRLHPGMDFRVVTATDEEQLRTFLADSLPQLVDAPLHSTRRCLYSDTLDGHFWIDRHPDIRALSVASGGSGHGFKFAPILGPLIADMVEGLNNPWLTKFSWRQLPQQTASEEAARFSDR